MLSDCTAVTLSDCAAVTQDGSLLDMSYGHCARVGVHWPAIIGCRSDGVLLVNHCKMWAWFASRTLVSAVKQFSAIAVAAVLQGTARNSTHSA